MTLGGCKISDGNPFTPDSTEMEWSFLVHKPTGLVLDRDFDETQKTFKATLQLQTGNDSQLWTPANGGLMNR